MHITSPQNPKIKSLLRLKTDSNERRENGVLLVEGINEIRLALAAGHRPLTVISSPEMARRDLPKTEGEWLSVTPAILRKLSVRQNPDGWLALFPRPAKTLADLHIGPVPLFLVLEAVEKPGNLGAMLRTSDAAGVDAVIVCDPRADVFGPNVVRASRGALFAVPLVEASTADTFSFLRAHSIRVVAANANSGVGYVDADLRGPLAIAMGTEDAGLSAAWLDRADLQVRIPMHGKVNSLNVSVAAALLVYEALRQRTA